MVSIEQTWKKYLKDCYENGKIVKKDDTEVLEKLGNYTFLYRPQDIRKPFTTLINSSETFLTNMEKGMYNIPGYPIKESGLYSYIKSLDSDKHIFCSDKIVMDSLNIDKPFVYTYPERLKHTMYNILCNDITPDIDYTNQIIDMLARLNKNIGTNRAVATLYHPGIDRERVDIPCLNWLQATVRENLLELHCMFRSNDLYGAWPSNMYLLTYLGLQMAEELDGVSFNGIHYHSSSLHIYKADLPEVEKILGVKK